MEALSNPGTAVVANSTVPVSAPVAHRGGVTPSPTVSLAVRAASSPSLSHLSAVERERFRARAEVAIDRVSAPLRALYPEADVTELLEVLLGLSVAALANRSPELRMLDARREIHGDWFQRCDRVGYVAYCEQFGPRIADVTSRLDHLSSLGVNYFHLMKVIAPRPEPNDGGFAVVDYRGVDPKLGTVEDLRDLATAMRARDMSLCIDVVMNHTAAEHEWAIKAKAGDPKYRGYYLLYPDRTIPDEYEKTLPEVFPEIAPGNFTWNEELKSWVWTTFNSYQWDLNYKNPAVLAEMLDTMLALGNIGVDVLRLDAVAFTWKRLGTNSQNQPEAHWIVQVLRAFVDVAAPGVLLKAEAIVGPRELTTYLGAHDRQRAECQLAYHNQLMVMIWSSLATGDAVLAGRALANLAPTPTTVAWATYVRCHDDIGWAVDDADAAGVGVNGALHRQYLSSFYRGDFPGSFAKGAAFSVNEETGDERTCGTTAGLCGIDQARESGDVAALTRGIERLLLAHGVAMSVGMPLLYMGDEVALANDASYLSDPDRSDDSRWMQRPKMDWAAVARTQETGTVEQRVYDGLSRLLATRATVPSLGQGGSMTVIDVHDPRVLALHRVHPEHGAVLVLANFAPTPVRLNPAVLSWVNLPPTAVCAGDGKPAIGADGLVIGARSLLWVLDPDRSGVSPRPVIT
jgi:amylosucrase